MESKRWIRARAPTVPSSEMAGTNRFVHQDAVALLEQGEDGLSDSGHPRSRGDGAGTRHVFQRSNCRLECIDSRVLALVVDGLQAGRRDLELRRCEFWIPS